MSRIFVLLTVVPNILGARDSPVSIATDFEVFTRTYSWEDPRWPNQHGLIEFNSDPSGSIEISFVKRPNYFSKSIAFCTHALPAAMADFLEQIPTGIRELQAIIPASQSFVPACKCYIGMMLGMNFHLINGMTISNKNSAENFCMEHNSADFGVVIVATSQSPEPPVVSDLGKKILRKAIVGTKSGSARFVDDTLLVYSLLGVRGLHPPYTHI
jgi:hypothetical protein